MKPSGTLAGTRARMSTAPGASMCTPTTRSLAEIYRRIAPVAGNRELVMSRHGVEPLFTR